MTYDDVNATYRREHHVATVAGNGTISGKFRAFQKHRLVAAHAFAEVAGTSAGHSVSVIHVSGTTTSTRATFALSTSTTGSQLDVTGIAATIGPGDLVYCVNGTDATGVASVTLELQQMPDAVRSAY